MKFNQCYSARERKVFKFAMRLKAIGIDGDDFRDDVLQFAQEQAAELSQRIKQRAIGSRAQVTRIKEGHLNELILGMLDGKEKGA